MDPSAYVRFALPTITLLEPPVAAELQIAAEDRRVEIAGSIEASGRMASSAPSRAIAAPEVHVNITPFEHPVCNNGQNTQPRPSDVALRSQSVSFMSEVAARVRNPIESDLVALATTHYPSLQQTTTTVLPVAPAVAGAGATTVLASLGRALSIMGERVLLVDANSPSPLDYFYKDHGRESGLLLSTHSLSPFEGRVNVLRTDAQAPCASQSWSTRVHRALAELRGSCDRILVTGRDGLTTALCNQTDGLCLVVVTPELRSLLAVPSILRMLPSVPAGEDGGVKAYFLLNRFDVNIPGHAEIRTLLAAELGSRLLPFFIPESPTVAESLARGLTPLDVAPQSAFTESCFTLAEWYRGQFDNITSSTGEKENQLVSD